MWNAASGTFIARLVGHNGAVTSAEFGTDFSIVMAREDRTADSLYFRTSYGGLLISWQLYQMMNVNKVLLPHLPAITLKVLPWPLINWVLRQL